MARKDWPRWIFASLADHLKKVCLGQGFAVWIDTIEQRTETCMKAGDRAEIRITGPFIRQPSQNYYRAFVDVHVALISRFDGRKNAYDLIKAAGAIQAALDDEIPVYNFGHEDGDYVIGDPTTLVHIGCLTPQAGRSVDVTHFGQIHEIDHVRQTECGCKYVIDLSE